MADAWTPELVAELCRLWDLGESALSIAKELCISRNAVIGKVHRLRKAGHPFTRASLTQAQIMQASAAARAVQEIARKKRERAALDRRAVRGGNIASMVRPVGPKVCDPELSFAAPVVIDATHAKPWTERAFGECAYPIAGEGADTVSCCARTGGKTYCAGHRAVMFKPMPTHQQKADKRLMAHLTRRFAA